MPVVDRENKIKYVLLHEKEEEENVAFNNGSQKTKNIPKPLLKIGKKVVLEDSKKNFKTV